eukprot:scaffold79966_cov32-Tisochrysis_lutea.AAC.2
MLTVGRRLPSRSGLEMRMLIGTESSSSAKTKHWELPRSSLSTGISFKGAGPLIRAVNELERCDSDREGIEYAWASRIVKVLCFVLVHSVEGSMPHSLFTCSGRRRARKAPGLAATGTDDDLLGSLRTVPSFSDGWGSAGRETWTRVVSSLLSRKTEPPAACTARSTESRPMPSDMVVHEWVLKSDRKTALLSSAVSKTERSRLTLTTSMLKKPQL